MISDSERAYLADLVMLQIENDSSNSSYIIYPDELQETYGLSREDADAVLDDVLLFLRERDKPGCIWVSCVPAQEVVRLLVLSCKPATSIAGS